MGYGGGGGGGGGSGGSGGGSGSSGGSGYRRVGDDRTANLKVDNITNRTGTDGTEVDGIVEVNTTAHFIPPSGTTAERGSRGRGLFGLLFENPANLNIIEYTTIATLGNTTDFGDLTAARRFAQSSSSSTRGVWAGGFPTQNTIDYVEIHSTGNAMDFGDRLEPAYDGVGTVSNGTRGYFMGGQPDGGGTIGRLMQYITFANKGNATFFGELSKAAISGAQCSSSTRGLVGGGSEPSAPSVDNVIQYFTLATTGDSTDFGDLTSNRGNHSSTGSSTRGLFISGQTPSFTNAIDYVTIASTGNALDFGDTTTGGTRATGSTSNSIRGVFAGGYTPTSIKSIDHVTISTTGNAADFGDLSQTTMNVRACSDSHGGLG